MSHLLVLGLFRGTIGMGTMLTHLSHLEDPALSVEMYASEPPTILLSIILVV